jgi:hypothetical protein
LQKSMYSPICHDAYYVSEVDKPSRVQIV